MAFYGGSFTGLPEDYQAELLGAVKPFLDDSTVSSIRLSTRPDYVDNSTARFLKEYGVGTIEIGIQSMDPQVLLASSRGHTGQQAEEAVRLLKAAGFQVGVQLMVGLPGQTTISLMQTAERVVNLEPHFVRIYPTLVIRDSGLDRLYQQGNYKPLSLNKAIASSVRVKNIFDNAGIKVVRMGLQPSENLERKVSAGPYHPAFGELVQSRIFFNSVRSELVKLLPGQRLNISICPADQSAFRGPKNINMERFSTLGLLEKFELVIDPNQQRYVVKTRF